MGAQRSSSAQREDRLFLDLVNQLQHHDHAQMMKVLTDPLYDYVRAFGVVYAILLLHDDVARFVTEQLYSTSADMVRHMIRQEFNRNGVPSAYRIVRRIQDGHNTPTAVLKQMDANTILARLKAMSPLSRDFEAALQESIARIVTTSTPQRLKEVFQGGKRDVLFSVVLRTYDRWDEYIASLYDVFPAEMFTADERMKPMLIHYLRNSSRPELLRHMIQGQRHNNMVQKVFNNRIRVDEHANADEVRFLANRPFALQVLLDIARIPRRGSGSDRKGPWIREILRREPTLVHEPVSASESFLLELYCQDDFQSLHFIPEGTPLHLLRISDRQIRDKGLIFCFRHKSRRCFTHILERLSDVEIEDLNMPKNGHEPTVFEMLTGFRLDYNISQFDIRDTDLVYVAYMRHVNLFHKMYTRRPMIPDPVMREIEHVTVPVATFTEDELLLERFVDRIADFASVNSEEALRALLQQMVHEYNSSGRVIRAIARGEYGQVIDDGETTDGGPMSDTEDDGSAASERDETPAPKRQRTRATAVRRDLSFDLVQDHIEGNAGESFGSEEPSF